MNIFVTGSNGFLAKYFRVFNNLKEHRLIFGSTSKNEETLQFEDLYSDIEDVLKDNIDIIIHFASKIPKSFSEATYADIFLSNITMINNLYNFAVKRRVKKFIYISSFGSMVKPESLDIKDFYTMSKITGEHFCSLMENASISAAALRISAPYGEYSNAKNVINIFIDKAIKNEDLIVFGSGKREQNFTYAGDIINAIELCISRDISGVYNIVSKQNVTMYDLAKIIIEITGSQSDIIIGSIADPQENYRPNYDYDRARLELGYEPQYSIREGLKRYINWLKDNENSAYL